MFLTAHPRGKASPGRAANCSRSAVSTLPLHPPGHWAGIAKLGTQQLALFGVGLLELNAIGFGHLDHLGPGCLQQLAVCGVCHDFLLHGVVNDHAGQFLLGDQLERNRHFHSAGEQFFHAFFAQCFTKAPQLRRVARPMVLLSKTPRKQAPLNIYLRVLTIRIHPRSAAFMRVSGVSQGRLNILHPQPNTHTFNRERPKQKNRTN